MPKLLQIRNVPESAAKTLKARAAESGESLNTYMLKVIEREVSRPEAAEVLERIRGRTERARRSAADLIRDARDERSG